MLPEANLIASEDPLSLLYRRLIEHFRNHRGLSLVVAEWLDPDYDVEWLANADEGSLPAARVKPMAIKKFDPWATSTSAMIEQTLRVLFTGGDLNPTRGVVPFQWQMLRALHTAVSLSTGKFLNLPFVHMVKIASGQADEGDGPEIRDELGWVCGLELNVTYVFSRGTLDDLGIVGLVVPPTRIEERVAAAVPSDVSVATVAFQLDGTMWKWSFSSPVNGTPLLADVACLKLDLDDVHISPTAVVVDGDGLICTYSDPTGPTTWYVEGDTSGLAFGNGGSLVTGTEGSTS